MAQTSINVRMDEDLKHSFETFCSEIGMSMTTAFCIFAKTAVREQKIPFELSLVNDPFYSAKNMERLKKAAGDMDAGKGSIHELIEDDND